MRWKAYKEPKVGDTRVKRKFFFFPQRFGETWIWFEFGDVYQRRVKSYIYEMGTPIPNDRWEDEALVNKPIKGVIF